MDHIGPNFGQIAPKQPIFKVETQDIGLLYVFVNTHLYKCIHEIIWAYTSENLDQVDQNWVNCLAKFGPKESSWRGEPIEVDVLLSWDSPSSMFLKVITAVSAYIKLL